MPSELQFIHVPLTNHLPLSPLSRYPNQLSNLYCKVHVSIVYIDNISRTPTAQIYVNFFDILVGRPLCRVPSSRDCSAHHFAVYLHHETAVHTTLPCTFITRLQCTKLFRLPSSRDCSAHHFSVYLHHEAAVHTTLPSTHIRRLQRTPLCRLHSLRDCSAHHFAVYTHCEKVAQVQRVHHLLVTQRLHCSATVSHMVSWRTSINRER